MRKALTWGDRPEFDITKVRFRKFIDDTGPDDRFSRMEKFPLDRVAGSVRNGSMFRLVRKNRSFNVRTLNLIEELN